MTGPGPLAATCSCCAGLGPETPAQISNRPGLAAIAHRVGTHSSFKASLLAALSRRDVPALAGLGSRSDDDFTVALIDGFATMADVLTFYSERIANEGFLRTAIERRSIGELARLIGYRLSPGLAAETYLAFTLDPPLPGSAGVPVTVDRGTRIQSVPGPGESAQTFETVEAIAARDGWNSLALQTATRQATFFGQREMVLSGTGHALAPGDAILVVGDERLADHGSERWDARLVREVSVDQAAATTRISWLEGLGSAYPRVNPAAENVRVHVFRQRAALFGHNAPDPRLMSLSAEAKKALVSDLAAGTWKGFGLSGKAIDLDQSYPKVVPDSWLLLLSEKIPHRPSSLPGYSELYRARTVGHQSLSAFGLASKASRIGLDTDEHLGWFGRRDTLVLCQSEELPLAERPVRAPVYGSRLALDRHVPGLAKGQALALRGAIQHLRVSESGAGTVLDFGAGDTRTLAARDRLAMAGPPEIDDGLGGRVVVDPADVETELDPARDVARPALWWSLVDRDGRLGVTRTPASSFVIDDAIANVPPGSGDPEFAEIVLVSEAADAISDDRDRTTLDLATPIQRVYDRATVRLNANVARATHGETVRELLGGGDGSQANQRLRLRQGPLTFVGADTPAGSASTLELRVDGTRWERRDSLFEAPPGARAYAIDIADDATTELQFGDGREGARLPTGQANVRATYRKGIGAAGNVRAGQLTSPLVAPVGLRAVINPEAATGGVDPEPAGQARHNAPQTVLTLGRAVSRRDYEDFAAAFAGIAKATASWVPSGPARGIVLTVVGPDGADIPIGGEVHDRLVRSLARFGDSTLAIRVLPARKATFALAMNIKVAPDADGAPVVARVRDGVLEAFGFKARGFGDGIAIDEVDAVVHRVDGVLAVDVAVLRRSDQGATPPVRPRLFALPMATDGVSFSGAELLVLDPTALQIGLMP